MTIFNKYMAKPVKSAASDLAAAGVAQGDYEDLKPALDVVDGLGRIMNNKKLYLRLLSSFPGSKMAEDITAAIAGGDPTKVQQTAHTLKGVSANLGFGELTGVSRQIEIKAKAGETANDLLPALQQAVAASTAAIERILELESEVSS